MPKPTSGHLDQRHCLRPVHHFSSDDFHEFVYHSEFRFRMVSIYKNQIVKLLTTIVAGLLTLAQILNLFDLYSIPRELFVFSQNTLSLTSIFVPLSSLPSMAFGHAGNNIERINEAILPEFLCFYRFSQQNRARTEQRSYF